MTHPGRTRIQGPWQLGVSDSPDLRGVDFNTVIEPPVYPQIILDSPPTGPAFFWYRRKLDVPTPSPGCQAVITFGAADWLADVWVDDQRLASNRGGYLPFEAVLPAETHGRSVALTVRVWDSPVDVPNLVTPPGSPPTRAAWIPRGKQHWYGECSGLWQPIWLDLRPPSHVTGLRTVLAADLQTASLKVLGSPDSHGRVHVSVREANSPTPLWTAEATGVISSGVELHHSWPDVQPWAPGAPNLYDVDVTLDTDGCTHTRRFTTGFRRIEADEDELRLNGQPIYLRGALDQDYSPRTGYAYPGDDALARRFQVARDAGLNLVRCHVKLPDPRYLALADRLGLLVWYDLPSWGHPQRPDEPFPGWLDDDVSAMLRDAAGRDAHHPSLIARAVINEGWGLDLAAKADHRQRLRNWVNVAREADPTRLIVDNSAMLGALHLDTDLADMHTYAAHPQGARDFGAFVDWLASRPPDLWERADAEAPANRPVALSEFGLWGLPEDWKPPAPWLLADRDWTPDHAFDQAGFESRFRKSVARNAFDSLNDLTAATRQVQAEGFRRQIARLRSTPGLSGFVLTELMDQGWEVNGLADFQSRPKPVVQAMRSIADETVVLIDGLPGSAWAGSPVTVRALISGPRAGGDAEIVWSVSGESRRRETIPIPAGVEPAVVDHFEFTAPLIESARVLEIDLAIRGPGLALGQQEQVLIVPTDAATINGKLRIYLTGVDHTNRVATLANALAEAGCTTLTQPVRTQAVVVAGGGGADALEMVAGGLPALIVADLADTPFLPSVPRTGRFASHWSTGFDWIAPQLREGLLSEPLMSTAFVPSAAPRVIPAVDGLDTSDILMGTFRGWLGNEAAITAQANYGKGKVVVTTLGLSQAGRTDPLARALLVRLIQYAASKSCNPTSRINLPTTSP